MRHKFLTIFLIGIFLISIVSATWYLPWTWWDNPEENIQQEGKLFLVGEGNQWNVLKSTGEESNTQIIFTNQKDKKTQICIASDINFGVRYLYNEDGSRLKEYDEQNKTTKDIKEIKWESAGCDINGTKYNGYTITLTNAQFPINQIPYVRFGNQTIVLVYQNTSKLEYSLAWANIDVILYKNISGNYSNTVNDLFVYYNEDNYKFGATDTIENDTALNNYKYQLKSNIPITKEGNILYVQNPVLIKTKDYSWYENHDFDFTDICSRGFNAWNTTEEIEGENYTITHYNDTADCKFSSYEVEIDENNTDYYYEVTFLSDKNIDPVISISDSDWVTTSRLQNITAETGKSNHTHLNISNTAPYDSLVGYWSFDGDLENTALTTAYDWSGEGNDGTYVDDVVANSTGGKYGEGLVLDGAGDWVLVDDNGDSFGKTVCINGCTFSAWAKLMEVGTNNIIGRSDSTSDNEFFRLFVDSNRDTDFMISSDGEIKCYVDYIGADVSQNVWYHYVGVYDNSTGTGNVSIYRDGVYLQSTTCSFSGINVTAWQDNEDVFIGTTDDSSFNGPWNGTIDEVMIFNTSLTADQILEIYNNQSARFLETGGQDIYNQTFMNISSGNNKVNVSTTIENLMGSSINLSVGYYDGSWSATAPQTISSLTNYTFDISSTSTNLTLNYTFIAGNDTTSFYSPIILGDISFEAWSSGGVGADTSFTVSLPVGYTEINFSSNNKTVSNLNADGQNSTNGVLYITNTGDVGIDIFLKMNSTESGFVLFGDTDNDESGATTINETSLLLKDNLASSSSQNIWLWLNWTDKTPQTISKLLNTSVTQN